MVDLPPLPPAIVEFVSNRYFEPDYIHFYCKWNNYDVYAYVNPYYNGQVRGPFPYFLFENGIVTILSPKNDEYYQVHTHCNKINQQLKLQRQTPD